MTVVATAWDESKHPREPRGSHGGGRWTTKLGIAVLVERPGGTVVVNQSTTPDRAYMTQILPEINSWPDHVPVSMRLAYATARSQALYKVDQPGFDAAALDAKRILDEIQALPPPPPRLPEGFPAGALDVGGPVTFWPEKIGTIEGEPMWKAMIDGDGNEVAWWFSDPYGLPHHTAVYKVLGRDDFLIDVSGYGDRLDDEFANDRRRPAMEAMVARHRRDIRDASEMKMALAAAVWDETKHPRHPAGSETGGEFAPKYGETPAWATAIDASRAAENDAQKQADVMHETEQRLNVGQTVPYNLDPAYAEFTAWAETMRKWYTEDEGFAPDYWPTQRDRLWNDYVNSVERGGSAVRARLAQADVPGLSMTPQLNTGNGGDLDALMDPERTHSPDFDVTMDADPLAHPADRPGFTVWTHEDGSIEVEDVLDVTDSTYFPAGPESPTAAAYVRAIDAARGESPSDNSAVTIYRGMSDREMDAWVNGEEIPAGKFFTDQPTTAYAQDIPGEAPVLQTFSVPRSMLIEVAPGEFQLRKRGKMRYGRIEPIVGAAWDETKHRRHPAGAPASQGGEFAPTLAEATRMLEEARNALPTGFPPGVFDPNDSVTFWPDNPAAYSGFSTTREGPFWKAIIDDQTGDELAFWFADRNGAPHHEDMNAALGRDEFVGGTFLAGYGDKLEEHGDLVQSLEYQYDYAASDIEALMEDGNSHELYDRFGLLLGDYEGMSHDEILAELVQERLAEYRRVPSRHRRDIEDARAIISGREAMSAAAGPGPLTTDEFNALVADERDALERFEPTLTRQYRARIRSLGREIAARFETAAAPALAAAAPPAEWQPPTVEQLLAGLALVAPEDTTATRRKAFEKMVDGILRRLGLSFDVTAILSQTILNGLAARSDGIIEGMRAVVARIVANSYLNGLSVPQTADAIMEGIDGIAKWQATQLARNDLVGMANGGSLLAARIVRERFPAVGLAYKEWLATDDERVRPTHWQAHEQRVPLETPFVVGTAMLAYPGDPSGPDEEVINCRCTLIYREEPAAVAAAAWEEAEHPRHPSGAPGSQGGEFAPKGAIRTFKAVPAEMAKGVVGRSRAELDAIVDDVAKIPVPTPKPGTDYAISSDEEMVRGGGFEFYRSSNGVWHLSGAAVTGLIYRDTADEIVQVAYERLDAMGPEITRNWEARLRGKTYTERNSPAVMKLFARAQDYNAAGAEWVAFSERWGLDERPILLNEAGTKEMGKDVLTSGWFDPGIDRVFVSGDLWKIKDQSESKYLSGQEFVSKMTPGNSGGDTVPGLLRHEFSHQAWSRMSDGQRSEFLSMVPADKSELGRLTFYASAAQEYYGARAFDDGKFPWQGEVFAEAAAATLDPNYDRADWPEWVNGMGDWIKAQRRGA